MCYKHAQLNPFLDIVEVFFTFWWDQEMNELKEKSIVSCKLWKDAGNPGLVQVLIGKDVHINLHIEMVFVVNNH